MQRTDDPPHPTPPPSPQKYALRLTGVESGRSSLILDASAIDISALKSTDRVGSVE